MRRSPRPANVLRNARQGGVLVRLDLGGSVLCTDATFGTLSDVVVDPRTRSVTHLIVEPHGGDGVSRLIPFALADPDSDGGKKVTLRCAVDAATELTPAQEYVYDRLDA